jgi:Ser/Thr protein kinase RdoA (MazF antagonist)
MVQSGMGVSDRHWGPIEPAEAAAVLGRPVEIVSQHLRWLFAVARCRFDGGELVLKRQPPMGRTIEQVRWQHRLTNHLADRGVPAARARQLHQREGLWYEVFDVASGADSYAGVDTWEPFFSDAHVAAAGGMLARMHRAGEGFEPREPQPQAGFVVQIDLCRLSPVAAAELMRDARPAVAEYLEGRRWHDRVDAAYRDAFERLGPALDDLVRTPLHGDWQTNNLFFSGDDVSGIIDFHQADFAPRLLDLAVAIERNCFFWNRISAGDDEAFDLRQAGVLVGAYHRESPLTPLERALLPDVLEVCQFEYGISFLDYYWGVERDREKADWAWETFVLGHAEWWQGPPGRRARTDLQSIISDLPQP